MGEETGAGRCVLKRGVKGLLWSGKSGSFATAHATPVTELGTPREIQVEKVLDVPKMQGQLDMDW